MREPSILASGGTSEPGRDASPPPPRPPSASRSGSVTRAATATGLQVTVAGFWRRLVAGALDAMVILPAWLLLAWLAGKLTGLHLPAGTATIDYWLDLFLAGDPALWGALGLAAAIGAVYLLVFQVTMGRTLGMRALDLRVIDVFGDPPSAWRAGARTLGYFANLATIGLGFVWVAFDPEKRGLHDWLAGTLVVRGSP
jgi:uncharacterized RDD family membrane protein YckC